MFWLWGGGNNTYIYNSMTIGVYTVHIRGHNIYRGINTSKVIFN